jgi:hypothetical protein
MEDSVGVVAGACSRGEMSAVKWNADFQHWLTGCRAAFAQTCESKIFEPKPAHGEIPVIVIHVV